MSDDRPAPPKRFLLALAEDADRLRLRDDVVVIDENPETILAEADLQVAVELARMGEYVAVYSSLSDAHRAFALFQSVS